VFVFPGVDFGYEVAKLLVFGVEEIIKLRLEVIDCLLYFIELVFFIPIIRYE
jgi:hypothetical protein